jgi:G:T/U-mismatch repair DNA glycosylase
MTTNTAVPAAEQHPLPPFLPEGARLLMLGSFPPARERWKMDFFYPNFQNDMWRIMGRVFYGDSGHFLVSGGHMFDRERIISFLTERGIALSDVAQSAVREKGNASDKFLNIVEHRDIVGLLERIPLCRTIVTTGDLASQTLAAMTSSQAPPVGGTVEFHLAGRTVKHYRMPSSSRAYPKPLAEKADVYAKMFRETGIL